MPDTVRRPMQPTHRSVVARNGTAFLVDPVFLLGEWRDAKRPLQGPDIVDKADETAQRNRFLLATTREEADGLLRASHASCRFTEIKEEGLQEWLHAGLETQIKEVGVHNWLSPSRFWSGAAHTTACVIDGVGPDEARMPMLDRQVVGMLFDELLKRGYRLSIVKNDDEIVHKMRDRLVLARGLLGVDDGADPLLRGDEADRRIRVRQPDGTHVGEMRLMLGGDRPEEILHPSCWDFEEMEEILAPAQALIDQHLAQHHSADAPAPI